MNSYDLETHYSIIRHRLVDDVFFGRAPAEIRTWAKSTDGWEDIILGDVVALFPECLSELKDIHYEILELRLAEDKAADINIVSPESSYRLALLLDDIGVTALNELLDYFDVNVVDFVLNYSELLVDDEDVFDTELAEVLL